MKTPNQELIEVDFSTVEEKLLSFDPGGLEAGNFKNFYQWYRSEVGSLRS